MNGYLAPCSGQEFADGTNADDIEDYRPGRKALVELGIRSLLAEAGLTKKEIMIEIGRASCRERV